MVGRPVSVSELLINAFIGFIFGYKIIGLFFSKAETVSTPEYIFSSQGSVIGGLLIGLLLGGLKWRDKNRQKLKEPERRNVRIWPHDRVGDIVVLGLIFGLLGAKIFDNLENWSTFVKDPIGTFFSRSGLTFYGGLIVAAIAICWYASKKSIKIIHLVDAMAPALILAYAIGRIGCQVAGDGDWGIYNSAYITDNAGKIIEAKPGEFQQNVDRNTAYFKNDRALLKDSSAHIEVKHATFKGPSFLPKWLFAYNYPQNVNDDGIPLANCEDEHCKVLPTPVFPTPLYETILGTLIFFFLWSIRKRIKTPGMLFAIYLILNGLERFTIELIRVNTTYSVFGLHPSQAELIAIGLSLLGIILAIFVKKKTTTAS
jgi:prolipoprotein diacylglyceryltransferase